MIGAVGRAGRWPKANDGARSIDPRRVIVRADAIRPYRALQIMIGAVLKLLNAVVLVIGRKHLKFPAEPITISFAEKHFRGPCAAIGGNYDKHHTQRRVDRRSGRPCPRLGRTSPHRRRPPRPGGRPAAFRPALGAGEEAVRAQIDAVRREKAVLIPQCAGCASPCGRNADFDLARLKLEAEEVQALKHLLLLAMRAMAPYASLALRQGRRCDELLNCFYDGLFAVGEALSPAQLQVVLSTAAEAAMRCSSLLDRAE